MIVHEQHAGLVRLEGTVVFQGSSHRSLSLQLDAESAVLNEATLAFNK
jgi:hypothetical protein